MKKDKKKQVKTVNLQPPPNLDTFSMQDKKKDQPKQPPNLDTRDAR
jgi:hypothetical protein